MTLPRPLDRLMPPPELEALYGRGSTYLAKAYPVPLFRPVHPGRPTPLPVPSKAYAATAAHRRRRPSRWEVVAFAAGGAAAATVLVLLERAVRRA